MANSNGPVIDMTPEGDFIEPPKPTLGAILLRLAMFGLFLCIAGVMFWVMFWAAIFVVPILVLLGLAGFMLTKLQGR
ncbi:hypothetical protein GCM10010909_20680 [Acidocella aquatica]|uniref:Transmembrane protein n=1 Tax=Acidocella aquatica TaxID=1922313 RepID=A0ABQ6A9U8_9PROT|nr:hypothetical protein [Acidocella aquatica]GLR67387.1 hypothetical protein GCM10010909_20680 [Acidocella aquatica]